MVEYAGITAALAVLVSSLGGLAADVGTTLPATHARAVHLVSTAAKREHVRAAQARLAYRKAPYRTAALKYLYTVGWVGATADAATCMVGRLLGPPPKREVLAALGRSPALLAALRKARIPRAAAATAIARGVTDACR